MVVTNVRNIYNYLCLSPGVREEESDEEEQDEMTGFKSPEQISAELVTLSLLSESRWKNLLSLDVIKVGREILSPGHSNKLHLFCPISISCGNFFLRPLSR